MRAPRTRARDDAPNRPITENEALFLSVAKVCKVVVACRVSPRQKALLVRLVRRGVKIGGKEPITLAVGDGANDVAMIQESRVGVGIAGREGTQAVNAADFSIAQFRFLQRLLLVHGRWNYRRIALMVLYIFYAHIVPVLAAFVFNFFNMWSGTSPYPIVWIVAYSYIVVIPGIFVAAFNRDISDETALRYPAIYVSGRANLHMGRFKIFEYVFKAISHASIISTLIYAVFSPETFSYIDVATIMYWVIVLTVLSRLALECYTWTWPTIVVYVICVLVYLVLEVIVYSSDPDISTLYFSGPPYTVLFGATTDQVVWAVTFLIVVICIFWDASLTLARRAFFPNLVDIVIEVDRGFSPDKQELLQTTNEVLGLMALPLTLPREAVSMSIHAARAITTAPRFRSAYAYDVVDEGNAADRAPRSRLNRFSMGAMRSRKRSSGARGGNSSSATARAPQPPQQPPREEEEAAGKLPSLLPTGLS